MYAGYVVKVMDMQGAWYAVSPKLEFGPACCMAKGIAEAGVHANVTDPGAVSDRAAASYSARDGRRLT